MYARNKDGAMSMLIRGTLRLMELLGHDEMPFGLHYSNKKPEGFGPKQGELFSRAREEEGKIDWQNASKHFTCLVGSLWLARKKRKAAWISHEECGCMGGGYYAGVYGPYLERIVHFVSTGVPGTDMEGEHYLPSPESMRAFLEDCKPTLGRGTYCVLKPLDQFTQEESVLSVTYFARPEVISALHSLTGYAAQSHNAVVSPFGAGCTSIVGWPLVYEQQGKECAVLGGFDLSARKFLKTDELTFSIPIHLYQKMLEVMEQSALTRHTWKGVRKKVAKSKQAWNEKA